MTPSSAPDHDPALSEESPYDGGQPDEDDLWFLPGPPEDEPDFLPPLPRAEAHEGDLIHEWEAAQAGQAARLAHVAARLGALDERLRRGPEGWRHRLALGEAAELSWQTGERLAADRLALWLALRMGSSEAEDLQFQKLGWAVRRLTGGPGPGSGLAAFLGRHETRQGDEAPLGERIAGLEEMLRRARALHPVTRACLVFHLWPMAGIGPEGERLEAAVTAARLAMEDGLGGAAFAPLAAGGGAGLRASGEPARRLRHWLDGIEGATHAALRMLDDLERWHRGAEAATADLSGRTPAKLLAALIEWPLLSAPMAERITGASRAAVQRNLTLFEARGLIREVTGQGRFRMWRCAA